MQPNRRLSILTFPQFFDGNTLALNVVVLPRNQNPLQPAIEQHGTIPESPAFADANLVLEARIVSSLAGFPNNFSANDVRELNPAQPANTRALFTALAAQFNITNLNQINNNANVNNPAADRADAAKTSEFPIRKYLPLSYRKSFNFTTPRTRAAAVPDRTTASNSAAAGAIRVAILSKLRISGSCSTADRRLCWRSSAPVSIHGAWTRFF